MLDAWANHRDESFLLQYLSPALIRKMRLFALDDEAKENHYRVASIHNERGYEKIRSTLARSYDLGDEPAKHPGRRCGSFAAIGNLRLQHTVRDGIVLGEHARGATLRHVRRLWGYDVSLVGVEAGSEKTLYETSSSKLAE